MVYKVKTIKKKRTVKKNRGRACTYKKEKERKIARIRQVSSLTCEPYYTQSSSLSSAKLGLAEALSLFHRNKKDTLIGNNNSGDADQHRGQMKGKEKETIKQNNNNKNRKGGKKRKSKSLK